MYTTNTRQAFDEKVRRGIFRPVMRHLPDHVQEDRLQDALGLTYSMFCRYTRRGQALGDALLVHACRMRAIDPGRHVVQADGPRKKDVYDPRNENAGTVTLVRLDEHADLGYAVSLSSNPTAKILSALNLEQWLVTLGAQDRELLELRAVGNTLAEIGVKKAMSTSAVFSRLKLLGLELAEHAGIEIQGHDEEEAS